MRVMLFSYCQHNIHCAARGHYNFPVLLFKKYVGGTSLAVLWLRLCTSTVAGVHSSPGQPCKTIWHDQIFQRKEKKKDRHLICYSLVVVGSLSSGCAQAQLLPGLQDHISPTSYQTHVLCIAQWILNHRIHQGRYLITLKKKNSKRFSQSKRSFITHPMFICPTSLPVPLSHSHSCPDTWALLLVYIHTRAHSVSAF